MNAHHIAVTPCATLPGMVLITFLDPQPEITTEGGNPARLLQTGCAANELETFLAYLEVRHSITLLRPGQVALSNPAFRPAVVTLDQGGQA